MRVVIAEDSVLLREGLTRLLEEAGHEVTGLVRSKKPRRLWPLWEYVDTSAPSKMLRVSAKEQRMQKGRFTLPSFTRSHT